MDYWAGKVALVTGGSSGLGLAIARALTERGAKTAIAARDQSRLASAAESLNRQGERAKAFTADVSNPEEASRLVARVVEHFGRLDLLVNNVGRSGRGEALATTPAEFQEFFKANFLSAVACTQAAAPHLIAARGRLVNIGSLASKSAARYLGAYPATKFALAAYTQQLRHELRPKGVEVLLVCPGPIAREDAGRRYGETPSSLPDSARKPGAGVKLHGISADKLALRILKASQRGRAELIMPRSARLFFVLSQLWPELGDWIIRRMT
jgi:NAD(P)-dependent dehydrogenase (short-subunit alcohol dehydrogenase family)